MIQLNEYQFSSAEASASHACLTPAIRRRLASLPQGARLLDVGCGNGSLTAALAQPGWQVLGVDSSHSGIEQARRHFPHIEFAVADLTGDLPPGYAPESFDAIVCVEVIEHVYDPRSLARNCHALLRPGGFALFTTPYNGYLKTLAIALMGKMDRHWDPLWDHGHIKFWSRPTLTRLLTETGFEIAGFDGAGRLPYLWKSMVMHAVKPA